MNIVDRLVQADLAATLYAVECELIESRRDCATYREMLQLTLGQLGDALERERKNRQRLAELVAQILEIERSRQVAA